MIILIVFLFIGLSIAQPNCGTVYTNNGGYQFAPILDSENGTAYGCFNESIMSTGWNTLWIETNSRFTDNQQVYSAGFLEGVLTQKWIFDYLEDNVIFLLDTAISCELGDIPGICGNSLSERISHLKNSAKIPRDIRMKNWREKSQKKGDVIGFMIDYFEKNKEWMNEQIQSNPSDAYWQNVELILQQYQGLQDGYNSVAPLLEQFFDWEFNLLHFEEDLPDLVSAGTSSLFKEISGMFKYSRVPRGEALALSHLDSLRCSSLVKYVGSDIFFAHDTWSYFLSMVRIFKQYNIPLHNPSVVSHKVSFSSYPGTLVSTDDFYLLDSGLAVTETTNNIYNMSLYQYVTPSTLLCPIRTILANRMSSSGSDWVHTFSKFNSGTYNNQWIILDYNLFKPNATQAPGLLYILEQVPGFVVWEDVTDYINEQGFWPSYNIPYFPFIFNISGYPEMVKQEGEQNSYTECARAQIFKRDQSKVNSLNTMKFMMRENDYKHDPLSLGDPGNAISSRFDLEPSGNNSFPFGGLDSKITSYEMFMNGLSCIAISGPTYQSVPAFSWENWSFIPHPGQPDSWQFDWILVSNFKENVL